MASENSFYYSTNEYIKNNQWCQLTLYANPFADQTVIDRQNEWLLVQLLIQDEFTDKTYDTLQRLFGPRTPSDWTLLLIQKAAFFPAIHFLLEQGDLDIRHPESIVRYVLHHGLYRKEDKIVLLDEFFRKGADVNEQEPRFRSSLLKYYIDSIAYELLTTQDSSYHDDETPTLLAELHTMVPYLLQKGADPLLTDRNGQHTIQMVQKYNTLPPSEKAWLLSTLESSHS